MAAAGIYKLEIKKDSLECSICRSHNECMKNKYALKNENDTIYYVGSIMDCPVEDQEGTLVDVTEDSFSFYADGEGYTYPISECVGWTVVKVA
jgi:uncharacterized protein (UPF0179 family)